MSPPRQTLSHTITHLDPLHERLHIELPLPATSIRRLLWSDDTFVRHDSRNQRSRRDVKRRIPDDNAFGCYLNTR